MTLLRRLYAMRRRTLFAAPALAEGATALPEGYSFRELTTDDFDRGGLFRGRGRAEKFRLRLRDGHRCFGCTGASGRPVSYIWYSGAGLLVPWALGLQLRPGPDEAYIWDCRTAPAERGRGLYPAALREARRLAWTEGARQLYIDCEPDNLASIKGIERAGFTAIRQISAYRLGGLRLIWPSGVLPCLMPAVIDLGSYRMQPVGIKR